LWDTRELSRNEAQEVVNVVFEAIADALNRGETVDLPFGTFEVLEHKRAPPPEAGFWGASV
jgi:nucleoid DNA-binding protein